MGQNKEMVGHIYGRINLLTRSDRPNMFIKEITVNIDFLKQEIQRMPKPTERYREYLNEFRNNLLKGIEYYREVFPQMLEETQENIQRALEELEAFREKLEGFISEYASIFAEPTPELVPA